MQLRIDWLPLLACQAGHFCPLLRVTWASKLTLSELLRQASPRALEGAPDIHPADLQQGHQLSPIFYFYRPCHLFVNSGSREMN